MHFNDYFVYFVQTIFPPCILFVGIIGNTFGFLISGRKNLHKIGPIYTYRFLYLMDTVYVLLILQKYIQFGFHIPYDHLSIVFCKMNRYFNYSLDGISPMLLVYITVDRFLSIKYSNKILRKTHWQTVFFAVILIFNLLLYIPVAIFEGNVSENSTTFRCGFVSQTAQFYISMYDFVNIVGVPFILMLTFNILLVYAIFQSRKRVIENHTQAQNETFKMDVKFAITTISLCLIYSILNLPLALINFSTSFSDFTFILCLYIFFCNYAVNFYVVLFTNHLVRKEFLKILSCRENSTSGRNNLE